MVKDGIFLSNRYEVLSKIGAGGMADVYKGRDCMLNRYVAIKILRPEFTKDESFMEIPLGSSGCGRTSESEYCQCL